MKHNYYFSIKKDLDGFVAYVPAFNITIVDDNLNDLMKGIEDSIELAVEIYKKEKKKIPEEDGDIDVSGKLLIRIPRSLHKKLYYLAKNNGVSINQFVVSKLAEA